MPSELSVVFGATFFSVRQIAAFCSSLLSVSHVDGAALFNSLLTSLVTCDVVRD